MGHLGYACINMTLAKRKILTGRTCRLATLNNSGVAHASKLALQNVKDLVTIIDWNNKTGIKFYRMTSDLLPWGNKMDITTYPDYEEICATLKLAGELATQNDQRLTFHPGPFNLLASSNPTVVENTVKDLEMHAKIMDLMHLSRTPYNKINIHIGATYGDKLKACNTWVNNLSLLSEAVLSRLTVENDDKASMYSVIDLYTLVHMRTQIPIVFDYHHHTFNTGDLTEQAALELACETWPDGIRPVVHYSESKALHESNQKLRPQAHSDYVKGPILTYNKDVDIMLEAKAKELALLELIALK